MTRGSVGALFGVLVFALAGCASTEKHTIVPGPPMLAGGRVVSPPGCGPKSNTGDYRVTKLIESPSEISDMIECHDAKGADDPSLLPAMREGQVLAAFSMKSQGSPPTFVGLEHAEGKVIGVFRSTEYCGGAMPPTYETTVLVELDARPTSVTSRLELISSNCPHDLP